MNAPETTAERRVLLVDDEPQVLEGLMPLLRKHSQVLTALSGEVGLQTLQEKGPFAAVVSDMRMPRMTGAVFLSKVRERWPDTQRLLLTGHADMESAISAVNDGQIFRFLTKPCPGERLRAALDAAYAQYRLVQSERVLLEQTLRGSVEALTNVLSVANPDAFGRANRVSELAKMMAKDLNVVPAWEVEVAAMLSQLGCVTLPPKTVARLYAGESLLPEEQKMVAQLPALAKQFVAHIPRLEGVQQLLQYMDHRYDGTTEAAAPKGDALPLGARILKVALDYDVLGTAGVTQGDSLATLSGRKGAYDPAVVAALATGLERGKDGAVAQVTLTELRCGMVLVDDVRTDSGMLLIARGFAVTPGLLGRLGNYAADFKVRAPLRVKLPPAEA